MRAYINRDAIVLALLWGASAGLVLSLVGYLLAQPEPVCPPGKHFVYPLEDCIGWSVVKGAHIP